jgi:hypothetical protein
MSAPFPFDDNWRLHLRRRAAFPSARAARNLCKALKSDDFANSAFCALETCTTTEANGRLLPNQANLGFGPGPFSGTVSSTYSSQILSTRLFTSGCSDQRCTSRGLECHGFSISAMLGPLIFLGLIVREEEIQKNPILRSPPIPSSLCNLSITHTY